MFLAVHKRILRTSATFLQKVKKKFGDGPNKNWKWWRSIKPLRLLGSPSKVREIKFWWRFAEIVFRSSLLQNMTQCIFLVLMWHKEFMNTRRSPLLPTIPILKKYFFCGYSLGLKKSAVWLLIFLPHWQKAKHETFFCVLLFFLLQMLHKCPQKWPNFWNISTLKGLTPYLLWWPASGNVI